MGKNTVWAIVLSTLVIVGSYLIIPRLFFKPAEGADVVAKESMEDTTGTVEDVNTGSSIIEDDSFGKENLSAVEDSKVLEETFTVKTDKVEVVLTNKGGDIISYRLIDHLDTDTQKGVELSDNVNEINRTCALALGPSGTSIVQDIFTTEKIDDYTYLFKKNINIDGRTVTLGKKYTFMPGEYVFKLEVLMHDHNGVGLNNNDVAYTIRTSPQIGPHFDPKKNRYESRQFLAFNGNKTKKINLANGQFKEYEKDYIWNGIGGKYFIELMIPSDSSIIHSAAYSTKVEVNDYANAQAMLERRSFTGSDIHDTYYMYFGPRNDKDLKRYNVPENNGWNIGGYRINQCLNTYSWLTWLETALKWVMELIHKVIPNWGVAIIILTILLKVLLFPLSKKQQMGTLKMQELQPKLEYIQSKYKNDQQKQAMELQKLYKEANYSPTSGCLPMILQMLVLFAMFDLFNNYFEFRGAMFIPGWIPDLSSGDSVYTLGFNIPFLGNQIRILPVIYLASQLLFGKITQNGGMTSNAPGSGTMKFMTYGMPIIFFFLFYNAPAGLLLYWTVSNIFQMIQQIAINKLMAAKKAEMDDKNSKKVNQKTLPPKNKRK